jgi:hypothetical protein
VLVLEPVQVHLLLALEGVEPWGSLLLALEVLQQQVVLG